MIQIINWQPDTLRRDLVSPFQRGGYERPLRITLHLSSFQKLSDEDETAIGTLRNLSDLPELDTMEIQVGPFTYSTVSELKESFKSDAGSERQIIISSFNPATENMSIYTGDDKSFRETSMYSHQFLELTANLTGFDNPDDTEFTLMLDDLIAACAHYRLKRDVLVTLSPRLLKHRETYFIKYANPRTPLETARIVGLFLRSRNNYTYKTVSKGGRLGVTRGSFYWSVVDIKMPHFWRYQNQCKLAAILRREAGDAECDTDLLAHSAILRCIRTLQARDAIGEKFYTSSGDEVRSDMLYHFYYLALLLSGVLDVQAIIAYRAYEITGLKEKIASFINKDFIVKLQKHGAVGLSCLFSPLTNAYYFIGLLHEVRNTIHRAEFLEADFPSNHMKEIQSSGAFVQVSLPQDNMTKILTAVDRYGSIEKWGLYQKKDTLLLEPYTFSYALVEECFKLIDKISEMTNLSGLFPGISPIPATPTAPLRDEERNLVRRIIRILG